MNHRYLLLFIVFLSLHICSYGENESKFNVYTGVVDAVSGAGLSDVSFELYLNDTIKIPIEAAPERGDDGSNGYSIRFSGPNGKYTLWADKEGYVSLSRQFEKKSARMGMLSIGFFQMQREMHKKLDEVTVAGTRVKMVMRGDTIVYDAAAFDLAEGSMLDALVSQLPGAELKDGVISVNGKPVSSLLVNGEDFFSGNPTIALQNLPAYTVKSIKVYDREARDAYLYGGKRPGDSEDIVMDVQLKKQYSFGWLGNADGGYGLDDRYAGKAFALGFADGLRISVYGNFNNTKDMQSAGTSGQWGGGWAQDGELALKMGGADYLWKKRDFTLTGNVSLTGEKADVQTRRSTVSFFDSGDLYGRYASANKDDKFHLISSHRWSWKGKQAYIEFTPSVDYLKNDYTRTAREATFTLPVTEQYRGEALDSLFGGSASAFSTYLLNRNGSESYGKSDWVIAREKLQATVARPGLRDNLKVHADGEWRRDKNTSNTVYLQAGQSAAARTAQYHPQSSTRWNVDAGAAYEWWYFPYKEEKEKCTIVVPKFDYRHSSLDRENILRQLREQQSDALASPSAYDFGRLPLDLNNTFNSELSQDYYIPSIEIEQAFYPNETDEIEIIASVSDNIVREQLNYSKASLDTVINRSAQLIVPKLNLGFQRQTGVGTTKIEARYSFSQSLPSITYQLNTVNDASPTDIYVNNPSLRKSASHTARLEGGHFRSQTRRSVNAQVNYNRTDHSVAQARYYDRSTGVNTWRPENVDGNWSLNGNVGYTVPFGRSDAFQFTGKTSAGHVNSADYASETDMLTKSVVRNLSVGQQAGFSYRAGKKIYGVSGGASWLRARSALGLFETIHALNYNARANCVLNFNYGWQIATDLNLYCRRGYSDNTLNTTDWIWNASVSKTFLKNKLAVKAEGVDILGQVSQVRNAINAQGRTETWVNSMPRYAMLHLIYRFQVLPARK